MENSLHISQEQQALFVRGSPLEFQFLLRVAGLGLLPPEALPDFLFKQQEEVTGLLGKVEIHICCLHKGSLPGGAPRAGFLKTDLRDSGKGMDCAEAQAWFGTLG